MIVDDNFLEYRDKEKIESFFFGLPPRVKWLFNKPNTEIGTNPEKTKFYLVSNILNDSISYEAVMMIFNKFIYNNNVVRKDILKIQGILVPMDKIKKFNSIDIEVKEDHKIFVYFLNDSDGYLYLSDGDKVSHRKGRGVLIDSIKSPKIDCPVDQEYKGLIVVYFTTK